MGGNFGWTPPKHCKEAPKPRCEKDGDDKDCRPVSWQHKCQPHHHGHKKKSHCG
jgi:hypothetical protein